MAGHSPFGIDDILKSQKPHQFPVDEILDEDERIVRGWVSVEVKDKQREVVPINELKRTLNTWMERDAPISDNHTNRKVGKGLRWFEGKHPESGKKALAIDYKIHDDYTVDDQVWKEIKSGKRKGLSFGGRATGEPEMKQDDYSGEQARHLHGLETYEIASVDDPANQFAENFMVNFLAKSADGETRDVSVVRMLEGASFIKFGKGYGELTEIQKSEALNEVIKAKSFVGKPFAGYKDFDDCVAQNSDKEDPNAYCATIMRDVEGKSKQGRAGQPKTEEERRETHQRLHGEDSEPPKERMGLGQGATKGVNDSSASKSPETAIDLKGSDVKSKVVNNMADKKQEENEDEKPQEEDEEKTSSEPATKQEPPVAPVATQPEAPQESPELQLLGEIKQLLLQLAQGKVASAKKEDEDEKPEEEPEDEKKQDDEESKPDPEGGDVKLPKAPAGETDEAEPPETDEVRVMEKVNKAVEDKLKSLNIATTPRPKADVAKADKPKQDEFALKMLEKAQKGEIDQATMNREVKKHIRGKYDRELKQFMDTFKKEEN